MGDVIQFPMHRVRRMEAPVLDQRNGEITYYVHHQPEEPVAPFPPGTELVGYNPDGSVAWVGVLGEVIACEEDTVLQAFMIPSSRP